MTFPPIFQYSQNNLQDYEACARRFQLRYLRAQQWPAPLLEPLTDYEAEKRLGELFHRMIERFYLGVPVDPPAGVLATWWQTFWDHTPANLPRTIRKPEATYSIPIGEHRLVAKFDLLTIDPHRQIVIVDWKTSRQRPTRDVLAERLQTLVYPFVAVEALAAEFGEPVRPSAIKLIYWFVNAPDQPEVFQYSDTLHADARARLETQISEIESRDETVWPLTEHIERCRACNYRSYCERGAQAASVNDADADQVIFGLNDDQPAPEIEL